MRYSFIFILALLPVTDSFSRHYDNFLERSSCVNTIQKSEEERKVTGTLKLNPFQVLACEVPVSFEIYVLNKKSLQLQVGYIFKGPGFPRFGPDNTELKEGLLSYRISPYCNDGGINIKIEFRNYKFPLDIHSKLPARSFYYAPQLMYKYSYYNNQSHWLEGGLIAYRQVESKRSSVLGAGIMIGLQKIRRRSVVDWYTGIGVRMRSMTIKITEQHIGPNTEYPNTIEDHRSVYPFINLGLRIGLEL